MQPRLGQPLLPTYRDDRDIQHTRGLVYTESAKETKFDHLALTGIDRGKIRQSIVEGDHGGTAFGSQRQGFIERDFSGSASPFLAAVFARMIHEDLAHELRGHTEEVRATLPIGKILRHELQVGFMDQCGRLQCPCVALVVQIT